MNNNLRLTKILELVDRLSDAVRRFGEQETLLTADYNTKLVAQQKAFELESWNQSQALSQRLVTEDAQYQTIVEHGQARFERREEWIRRAERNSRKQALEQVEQQEGRRKYQLQKSVLENDRRRDAGLANAAAELAAFKQQLAETELTSAELEAAAGKAFRGFGQFRRLLSSSQPIPEADLSPDEHHLHAALLELQKGTRERVDQFRRLLLPRLFGRLSIWLIMILVVAGHSVAVPLLHRFGVQTVSYSQIGISLAGILILLLLLFHYGRAKARPMARAIALDLARAQQMREACYQKAEARFQRTQATIQEDHRRTKEKLDQEWQETVQEAARLRDLRPQQIETKKSRAHAKNQQLNRAAEARIEQGHQSAIRALRQEAELNQRTAAATFEREQADLNADYAARRAALDTEWKTLIEPLWTTIQAARREADHLFASWENPAWSAWQPPVEFRNAALFGHLTVKPARLAKSKPESPAEVRALPEQFTVPLLLTYPQQGSILFESTKTGAETAVSSINNIIFRLLSTTPPGKLSFTIFDPVGLGQSFAGLMHLADYAESYINSRIWTQTPQIEQKLAELNEHMEKVIQMYLRNEYPTIAEYNAQAGAIAEKYHFLVVAGFPLNFSETAARRLLNIAASGARCGVFTLIHWDHRYALPHGFVPDELRRNSVCLLETEAGYTLADWNRPGADLILEEPPSAVLTTRLLQIVGEHSRDTNRVEVPFSQVAPANSEVWSEDTAEELRVPIGRSGATKLQYLAVGRGTRQHALIAGKTGSGKSTLFHVIITNLGLWCSPDQVEFYLVDFKKGVEFKCYATRRLPHARVVAIESDREFGLSVLQRVDEELRHRGDLFRREGVQDLPGYKRAGGKEPTPRCLLIIDEFQEFFVEEDRISQHAAVLLDRIVRQGRAFGIHVLLGSQTLGGAYTLARATLGQMVIRIALQCNEADAYLIMDENNAAPRLLSRPGEGIYNDAAGALQANSPFQTVWLPDEVRDELLVSIRARANASSQAYPDPIVFEGNAPADIRENAMLNHALAAAALPAPPVARIWLGAPNSIKGPTEAALQRQSGNNLLIVGQREEAALAMVAVALVCLAAQYPAGTARLILFESTNPNSPQREFLDRTIQVIPHGITRHRNADLPEVLEALALELAQRESGDQGPQVPPVFLIIQGLENFKKLRQEDEFSFSLGAGETRANLGATFVKLLSEGPAQGIHIIATCDTYNNVTRFLGRKALTEIAMRVLFQMSAADSASLAESPAASNLGLHRALFYNDQEGVQETFRPYAMPGSDWFDEIAQKLARLATIKNIKT